MIRSFARVKACGRYSRAVAGVLAAGALAAVAAACGTSSAGSAGPYGPPPSSASAGHGRVAGGAALTLRRTALGTILTTGQGFTVYAVEADQDAKSACFGACAAVWPPVTTTSVHVKVTGGAVASLVGQATRPGGVHQLTYAGHPLYRFAGDTGAGATSGQGSEEFGARWDALTAPGKNLIGG